MKRLISFIYTKLPIFLFLIIPLFSAPNLYAHPMDTSQLRMYLYNDNSNQPIENNRLIGEATFNWLQFSAMTNRNENPIDIYKDIDKLDPMFIKFISENIKVSNNNEYCNLEVSRIKIDDVETVIVDGIKYKITSTCSSPIHSLIIENIAFKDEILTQLNTVSLYSYNKELMEPKESRLEYQTNYSPSTTNPDKKNLVQNTISWFKDITNVQTDTPSYLILFVVYLVGILHAFEGGHNKIILGSLVINKKVNLKQAFIYTIIFTLTHISDIIILSIGLVFLGRYIDIYSIFPNLRIATVIVLAILSLYWLFKELRHIFAHKYNLEHDHLNHNHDNEENHHHNHDHQYHNHSHEIDPKESFKSQLSIAFISGLAPCITGWSIFMLLFSSGRLNLMIPGNIVFGLGVFTVLSIYTIILMKTKTTLLNRFGWIGEYSNLISSSLILLTTTIQLINIIIS